MIQRLKFEIWKNIHSLPIGLIRRWQLQQLKGILEHAYLNTGLYRNLWDQLKVSPEKLKTLEDLKHFPIINKKIFLNLPVEDYIGLIAPQLHEWRYTSGTSGQPFQFVTTNIGNSYYNDFLLYRFLYWRGVTLKTIRKKLPIVKIKISIRNKPPRIDIPLKRFLQNPDKTIEEIFLMRPAVIETFPSILVELSRRLARSALFNNFRPGYAISYGETLKSSQRIFIENNMGCEVYDRYGLEEFGAIGVECSYHKGFHLNNESFYLEIVDENDSYLAPGKTGRIIITDFRNYAMPFIRYDTGDRGYFLPDDCPCGLRGKKFVVEGRMGEFVEIGSQKIHHLEFDKIMESFSDAVLQYQIIKVNGNSLELLIIPGPAMTQFILDHIRDTIKNFIGTDAWLKIKFVDVIKRTPGGKCQTLINN